MAQLEVLNQKGESVGNYDTASCFTETQAHVALMHKAVVTEEANSRQGTQSTKTRAEVRGGGRKPYKQKKTGRARQGSIRAPHYRHGGVAFAPKPRDYSKKINKKEKQAALMSAIASRLQSGDISIIDKIVFDEIKTKHANQLLQAVNLNEAARVLVILPEYNENIYKCFRNIQNVVVKTAPITAAKQGEGVKSATFSTRDLLVAHKILITQDALKITEEAWTI